MSRDTDYIDSPHEDPHQRYEWARRRAVMGIVIAVFGLALIGLAFALASIDGWW